MPAQALPNLSGVLQKLFVIRIHSLSLPIMYARVRVAANNLYIYCSYDCNRPCQSFQLLFNYYNHGYNESINYSHQHANTRK